MANLTNLASGQNRSTVVGSEFRRQLLWQKAQTFAVELTKALSLLPRSRPSDILGAQLLRSGSSIAANIAEGYGRYSQAAYRNHLSFARGSAFETESWLDLLEKTGPLPPDKVHLLMQQCTELQKLLTLRMKALGAGKTYAAQGRSQAEDVL